MLSNFVIYLLFLFALPFATLCFFVRQYSTVESDKRKSDIGLHSLTHNRCSHDHVSSLEKKNHANRALGQQPSHKSHGLLNGQDPRAKNEPSVRNEDNVPKVVIAYATYSQSSLILAHKLLNFLTNVLQDQPGVEKEEEVIKKKGYTCSSGAVTNFGSDDMCCEQQTLPAKRNNQKTKETSLNESSSMIPKKRVTPIIKVLELAEVPRLDGNPIQGNSRRGLSMYDVDMLLEDASYVLSIFIVSTFTEGKAPPRSQTFEAILKDAYEDHRIPRSTLAKKRFALFGLGDAAYGETYFNTFAKHLYEWCRGLGAPPFIVPPVYASQSNSTSLFQIFALKLERWLRRTEFYSDNSIHVHRKCISKKNPADTSSVVTQASHDSFAGASEISLGRNENVFEVSSDEGNDPNVASKEAEEVEDVEDLVMDAQGEITVDSDSPPQLLYPKLEQNLIKQGYHIVGSHSAVKLCRWTKSMLRGRGGCYKHTFYNINSSQCMEMTPSLACANKCVFCWRHHTNPVSRTFRWKQDPPAVLIEGGMAEHYRMIKQMRGVPGVTPERLIEAMKIRHCALSLVGEPIMYPQINEFCHLLHAQHISSFMVTNAQFPEQLRNLIPVTQLYLSVDAATPEELKRIDRPLFEDYWERCLACVRELRKKKQRTVFRLTLVNQYNNDNVAAYADLVEMAWPDFIEVKGVTYCGTSSTSTLTMKDNVPRHDEVIAFAESLCKKLAERRPGYVARTMTPEQCPLTTDDDPEIVELAPWAAQRPYHIACEHEHSCCVLIALDKFYFNQRWHTWINYEKFHALVNRSEACSTTSGPEIDEQAEFTSLDYVAPTPSWAIYKSKHKGFDPSQTRVLRRNGGTGVVTSGC